MRVSSALLLAALVALPLSPICLAQSAPAKPSSTHHARPAAARPSVPDVIFFDGVIYTGVGFAEDHPQTVQAMAIGGGKVIAVGTTEEVTRLAGPKTRLRDLNASGSSVFLFPGSTTLTSTWEAPARPSSTST
jgi:hypothetical protein